MTTRCARYGECASSSFFLSFFLLCGLISLKIFKRKEINREQRKGKQKAANNNVDRIRREEKSVHGCSATLVFTTIMYIFQIKLNTTQHPSYITCIKKRNSFFCSATKHTKNSYGKKYLISVGSRLERTFNRDVNVLGLFLGQFGQLDANLFQVQLGNLFVQVLRQKAYTFLSYLPDLDSFTIPIARCTGW